MAKRKPKPKQPDPSEDPRWKVYRAIPKKDWLAMSGRQAKVIHDQARRYGFPLDQATIDLPAFVAVFHDFLAKHHVVLGQACRQRGEAGDDDHDEPSMERYRLARARMAELDLAEREGQLLPRPLVHDGLTRMATLLRACGESLQRNFGAGASQLLNETIDSFEREIDSLTQAQTDADPE